QVPALGSDRFVTSPDCAEGSCLPDDSSSNAGEASHGYEVGLKKSTPWLSRQLSQVRRGQNEPKFLVVYLVGKLERPIEISSSLFTALYAIKSFASIALFSRHSCHPFHRQYVPQTERSKFPVNS